MAETAATQWTCTLCGSVITGEVGKDGSAEEIAPQHGASCPRRLRFMPEPIMHTTTATPPDDQAPTSGLPTSWESMIAAPAPGNGHTDPPPNLIPLTLDKIQQALTHPSPVKRRLPRERSGNTHKFSIAGHEGYLTVNTFEDGAVGEIFLRMAKQGSIVAGFCDVFGILVSVMLQNGVPLAEVIDKLKSVRFEPNGLTETPAIPKAASIVDFCARVLEWKYLLGKSLDEEVGE